MGMKTTRLFNENFKQQLLATTFSDNAFSKSLHKTGQFESRLSKAYLGLGDSFFETQGSLRHKAGRGEKFTNFYPLARR